MTEAAQLAPAAHTALEVQINFNARQKKAEYYGQSDHDSETQPT